MRCIVRVISRAYLRASTNSPASPIMYVHVSSGSCFSLLSTLVSILVVSLVTAMETLLLSTPSAPMQCCKTSKSNLNGPINYLFPPGLPQKYSPGANSNNIASRLLKSLLHKVQEQDQHLQMNWNHTLQPQMLHTIEYQNPKNQLENKLHPLLNCLLLSIKRVKGVAAAVVSLK